MIKIILLITSVLLFQSLDAAQDGRGSRKQRRKQRWKQEEQQRVFDVKKLGAALPEAPCIDKPSVEQVDQAKKITAAALAYVKAVTSEDEEEHAQCALRARQFLALLYTPAQVRGAFSEAVHKRLFPVIKLLKNNLRTQEFLPDQVHEVADEEALQDLLYPSGGGESKSVVVEVRQSVAEEILQKEEGLWAEVFLFLPGKQILELRQVNKRFHGIVTTRPNCFTSLELNLSQRGFDEKMQRRAVDYFGYYSGLKHLSIESCLETTKEVMKKFIPRFKGLERLSISTDFLEGWLDHIGPHLKNLRALSICNLGGLSGRHQISSPTFKKELVGFIQQLENLESLSLSAFGDHFTDTELKAIAISLKNLKSLNLSGCGVTVEGLATLPLENIQELSLDDTTDDDLKKIALRLVRVENFTLSSYSITDQGLNYLAYFLPELEALSLQYCKEIRLGSLVGVFPKLKRLILYHCPKVIFAGDNIEVLVRNFPELQDLTLQSPSITDRDVKNLVMQCSKLKELCLFNCLSLSDQFQTYFDHKGIIQLRKTFEEQELQGQNASKIEK